MKYLTHPLATEKISNWPWLMQSRNWPFWHLATPLLYIRPSTVISSHFFSLLEEVGNIEETYVHIFDRFISFFVLILWVQNSGGANFDVVESSLNLHWRSSVDRRFWCHHNIHNLVQIQDREEMVEVDPMILFTAGSIAVGMATVAFCLRSSSKKGVTQNSSVDRSNLIPVLKPRNIGHG